MKSSLLTDCIRFWMRRIRLARLYADKSNPRVRFRYSSSASNPLASSASFISIGSYQRHERRTDIVDRKDVVDDTAVDRGLGHAEECRRRLVLHDHDAATRANGRR